MIKIGVTGGIGSGKSTVTKILGEAISHYRCRHCSKRGFKIYPEILEKVKIDFGGDFSMEVVSFDGKNLEIIYLDLRRRKKYEGIILPYIKKRNLRERQISYEKKERNCNCRCTNTNRK